MMTAQANRAYVRELLTRREPALAAALDEEITLPCGPRCQAVPVLAGEPVIWAGFTIRDKGETG